MNLVKALCSDDHLLLLPVKHVPCYMGLNNFEDHRKLFAAVHGYIGAVRRMCKEVYGKDLIVWERWVPMRNSV